MPQANRTKLHQKLIEASVYDGSSHVGKDGKTTWSRFVIWDSDVVGLGLRITPSGKKSFILSYRANGRKRFLTLGAYGTLTLKQARDLARRRLVEVFKGGDPLEDRQAGEQAPTVEYLAKRYLEEHAEVKKKPKSVREDRRNLERHVLPRMGSLKISDVTRRDVADLHHSLRETPFLANRVLALLSKVFNLAEAWGLRADGSNPTRHVQRYQEKKRKRYLTDEELRRLAEALRSAEKEGVCIFSIACIRILLLTGARHGEILQLKWSMVDLRSKLIRLDDSKTGEKEIVLPESACKILEDLPRVSGNPYVVAGRDGKPRYSITKPWNRVRALAGLEDFRLHDLRHSFASAGIGGGLNLAQIGILLGHSNPATTSRYAHLAVGPARAAAGLIEGKLGVVAGVEEDQEAIALADQLDGLSARIRAGDSSARGELLGLLEELRLNEFDENEGADE